MMSLPSLFISHGAPTFALSPGLLGPQLTALGRSLPKPRAVLVMSPHWSSRRQEVGSAAAPATVHDFGGFPRALYELDYPAAGAPGLAAEVIALLGHHGLSAVANDLQGRDHGAWVPMMHLYPQADVPVLQISQPAMPLPSTFFEIGQALSPLRKQGVLIVGSGSLTHNLYEIGAGAQAGSVARNFADWVWTQIARGDLDALLNYRSAAPAASRAHPTDEHFLPLFFAIGAAGNDWMSANRLEGGMDYDVLAMDSFVLGAAPGELSPTH
ncbi:MAG: dioxygenase [Rhodocyclaceae bacterium]|nr:dioxygenase [Rhodocyclaceae bacterium]